MNPGAGGFVPAGLLVEGDVLPLFKPQGVLLLVPVDLHLHVFAGILGGAEPQAVEPQGKLVVVPGVVLVLAPGIQLAEHQLPVVALLVLVIVHRNAPAEVLHLNGAVQIFGDDNGGAVPLPGFVDGVGEDFKHRVLTALQPIGAEDHRRAFAHPVRPL